MAFTDIPTWVDELRGVVHASYHLRPQLRRDTAPLTVAVPFARSRVFAAASRLGDGRELRVDQHMRRTLPPWDKMDLHGLVYLVSHAPCDLRFDDMAELACEYFAADKDHHPGHDDLVHCQKHSYGLDLGGTYRAADTHLQEENDLLPWGERAEVDGRESADGDGADTVEERVDIADVELPIGCVEYPRGYQGSEGTAGGVSQSNGRCGKYDRSALTRIGCADDKS